MNSPWSSFFCTVGNIAPTFLHSPTYVFDDHVMVGKRIKLRHHQALRMNHSFDLPTTHALCDSFHSGDLRTCRAFRDESCHDGRGFESSGQESCKY